METRPRTYFDYNASAPLLSCARDSFLSALDAGANPSSVHFEGREARKIIENSRSMLAELINADPGAIVFTSSATEAAVHALSPKLRAGGQEISISALYVGATEHPCILAGGRFSENSVVVLPVCKNGIIDTDVLVSTLENHDYSQGSPMVCIQLANSETGVVQPIQKIEEIVHSRDGFLVVDAVQALGKIPFKLADTGADFLILSSHKIGGPQGVGVLVLGTKTVSPAPLLTGGGQENYHRSGTENVAAISGFGAACRWHSENLTKNIKKYALRDSIEEGLSTISLEAGNSVAQPVFFGKSAVRLGNTTYFAVPGIKAETALVALDLAGVSVSSGSACSSGKVKQSHVLAAMGSDTDEMAGALRVSIGWESSEEDASRFLVAWKSIVDRMVA